MNDGVASMTGEDACGQLEGNEPDSSGYGTAS